MKTNFTKQLIFLFLLILMSQIGNTQTYIWGGPGDVNSEFAGGLNDWTVNPVSPNDSAIWIWEADGKADRGNYWFDRPAIVSPTIQNGAAVFDSDYYDNGGTDVEGAGPAPHPQVGDLISPEFSCEGHESVWVKFNQYYRNWQSTPKLYVSIDGGVTWETGIEMNSDVVLNSATPTDSEKLIDISSIAKNQATVRIKFTWEGSYYFWILDDVYVLGSPPGDPKIVGTWYPPNRFNTPKSLISNDSMYFIMDVINKGGKDMSDIKGKVSVVNRDLEITYFEDSISFDLRTGDTTQIEFKSFMPHEAMDTGLYVAAYEIEVADAATSEGKVFNQYFRINEPVYVRDEADCSVYNSFYSIDDGNNGQSVSFQGSGAAGPVYDCYNITYYKLSDWVENSIMKVRATRASVAISLGTSSNVSYPVSMFVFELADTLNNQLFNWNFLDGIIVDGNQSTQLVYVGYAAENIEDVPDYSTQTFPLTSADDEYDYVDLKPNKKYFLASLWPKGQRYYHVYDNTYAGNKRFFYDQRLALIYLDDGSGARYYTLGGDYGAWMQGMNLEIFICPDATEDNLLPNNTITIVQNPVKNDLKVDISFENTVDHATMVIHDINGAIINMRNIYNLKEDTQKYMVGNLPNGTYIFSIFTKDKMLSKKFIVTK